MSCAPIVPESGSPTIWSTQQPKTQASYGHHGQLTPPLVPFTLQTMSMDWWSSGRAASLVIAVMLGFGASACSEEDFPPKEPLAAVCPLLKGEEVAAVLPNNDGGRESGQENLPSLWVRSCSYVAWGELQAVHLAIDGALNDDGADLLKDWYDSMGGSENREEISGVGDEAVFWDDSLEVGMIAKANGYLVILTATVEPPPTKAALAPLASKAISRLP